MSLQAPSPDPSQVAFRRACAEVDRKLRAGEPTGIEEWVSATELTREPELAVELIFTEYVTREELGHAPTPDEYYARFPSFADRLRRLFNVDQLLQDTAAKADTRTNRARQVGPPPDTIGGYEIREKIGAGGMGVVYRAWDPELRREVALKLLHAGGVTAVEVARVRQEAEVVARMNHPNVVQVYGVGEADGRPYMALELVDGPNLRTHVGGKPLSPADAAVLVQTLALAVHHAHERGIVHRDLKPANVLVASTGPKITDFGLAARVGPDVSAGATGQIVGTAAYMPPEQAEARPGWVTPAVDVYALGAILYELLTGRPPFLADTPLATLNQVLDADPVPPRVLAPAVSRDLETVCLACLRKDPTKRYQTAAALADDLGRVKSGEPIAARPAGPLERALKWSRRRPATAASLLVAAVALVMVVVGSVVFATRLKVESDEKEKQRVEAVIGKGKAIYERQKADDARAEADTERAKAEELLGTVRGLLYADQVSRASAVVSADPARAARLLADPRRCRPEDREFAWRFVQSRTRFAVAKAEKHTAGINALAASDDGSLVVTGGEDGAVHGWDGATGAHKFALDTPHGGPVTAVAVAPDGSAFVTGGEDFAVRVWDAKTRGSRGVAGVFAGPVLAVAIAPDGKTVAAGGPRPEGGVAIRVFDGKTPELKRGAVAVRGLAFSPTGNRLLIGSATPRRGWEVIQWDFETNGVRYFRQAGTGFVTSVAFSPNGQQVAASILYPNPTVKMPSVRVWDARTTAEVVAVADGDAAWGVRFAPDGKSVAVAQESGAVSVWELKSGLRQLLLPGHDRLTSGKGVRVELPNFDMFLRAGRKPGSCSAVVFTQDGQRLVTAGADRTVRVWEARSDRFRAAFAAKGYPGISVAAFAPTAKGTAYVATSDRTLRAWDPRTGTERVLAKFDRSLTGVAVSNDGAVVIAMTSDLPAKAVGGQLPAGAVHRVDPKSGKVLWSAETKGVHGMPVAVAADGSAVVCASKAGILSWDAATGALGKGLPFPIVSAAAGAGSQPGSVWVAAGRQSLLFDPGKGEVSAEVPIPFARGAATGGGRVAVADVTGSPGMTQVTVFEAATGKPVSKFEATRDFPTVVSNISPITVSPDGRTVATAAAGVVRLWHADTGQELATVEANGTVLEVRFSPDGSALYANVRTLDPHTSQVVCWFAGREGG